jgi:hypothetical protein
MGRPATKQLDTLELHVEQRSDILDGEDRAHIVHADKPLNKEYLDELAFNEEPVKIRIGKSAEKNAPESYPVWVNGKGGEVLINDRWVELKYLPVNQVLITKRKYVGSLISAKADTITTAHDSPNSTDADSPIINRVQSSTNAVCGVTIIEDKNPKGAAWATELLRRNW